MQHTPLSFLLQTWRDIDYGDYDDGGDDDDDGNDGDADYNVADLIMNKMMMVEMIMLQTWPFSSASASFHLQLPLSSVLNSVVALLNVSPGNINLVMMLVHMILVIDHLVIDDYKGSTKKELVFFWNNSWWTPLPLPSCYI